VRDERAGSLGGHSRTLAQWAQLSLGLWISRQGCRRGVGEVSLPGRPDLAAELLGVYRSGVRDDVSVMILSTPVTTIAPAALPPRVGYLDTLGLTQSSKLTVVGYGTSEKIIVKGENGPQFPFEGDRGYGIGTFNALTPQWLKMSQNAAHGDSGACYGDSGGPTFLGAAPNDGDVVLAVTSTGDTPCYSTNVAGRTDSPSARAFLATLGL
jgi:hypothetical protein